MKLTLITIIISIAAVFGTTKTSKPIEQKAQNHIVEIKQLKFIPAYIEVNKGDTITFINKDVVDHDVTEEKTKKWTSNIMKKGTSWRMVVKENADYFCSLHVIMKGKIRIKQ